MTNIYPFKAITPISGLEYEIQNKFIFCPHRKVDFSAKFYEKKLVYINDLLQQNLLHKHTNEYFYCCRISNRYFSVIGLITLVNANLVNKTIFKHERCVHIKEETYLDHFKKHKAQIAPIILMHEDNLQINKSLNNFINNNLPFFTINDNEYKYELWTVSDLFFYKELYSSINSFLVADGHHRLSSMNLLGQNELIAAFLVSVRYIKSADICREYLEISSLSKKKIFSFLYDNFSLIKTKDIKKTYLLNGFLFKLDSDIIYQVMDSNNDYARRNILEFLDNSINYKNNKLNFYNYSYSKHHNLPLRGENNVSVLIPALKIVNKKVRNIPLYPPHSTLFYPKLPDGLISFYIE